MALALLFIVDPLDELKAYKDSSVAMMREAAGRGHEVLACTLEELAAAGGCIEARAHHVLLVPADQDPWYLETGAAVRPLSSFDAVLMRKDPPFDIEFLNATLLLSRAAAQGALVVNDAQALRDHNEKLAILEFPEFTVPALVSRDIARLRAFWSEQGDIVVKPLDGMGGTGVFRLAPGDGNAGSILETVTAQGTRAAMAQRYIPEIAQGDKRVLVIGGEPVPFSLARVPAPGEMRGNLAAGGTGHAQPLSERDRVIASTIGRSLLPRGLLLLGLDVIGDHLTEINVTSPTCFVEISQQSGFNVAAMFIDALEKACT
jgi:glutathione synthase